MAKLCFSLSFYLLFDFPSLSTRVRRITDIYIIEKYLTILIENVNFSIPEEKWYTYPAWIFLHIQVIIVPVICFSAISTKILMRKEMKRYFFGNSVHPVRE